MAAATPSSADARSAAIVIDAKSGKILYSSSAEARRYPASLTKMMTLYLTFEAMAAGKINKKTPVPFSAQASAKPPTKLGVKAGNSITVETAILSLVTKSANDSATALGELLGGSEAGFARMMTAKARSLGMSGTVFRNASGLPDSGQFTTAHDMARLGMALRQKFPQYYPYFSTRSFTYGRQRMANHNRLLGRIKGVDGIKTGYTNASGFNLVSSVSDGNRRIVAVVMGGASGASRDRQMAALIQKYLPQAVAKGSPLIASLEDQPVEAPKDVFEAKREAKNGDRIEDAVDAPETVKPLTRKQKRAPEAAEKAKARAANAAVQQAFVEEQSPAPAAQALDQVQTASVPSSGWAVQVASSPSKGEATAMLDKTQKQAGKLLAARTGFTIPFQKGGVTYHRVRFGGFETKTAAWNACTTLKKKKIACYAVEN